MARMPLAEAPGRSNSPARTCLRVLPRNSVTPRAGAQTRRPASFKDRRPAKGGPEESPLLHLCNGPAHPTTQPTRHLDEAHTATNEET
ncbi:hypothetical protein TNCT6_77650 [Streptomyces sp. 6-11-2]|nr:hypothetical protein TNCT6_77650 [Streptomyces sp. 6-11-2]